MTTRPPLPPFTQESATQKVRLAEDGWNSRDPEKVALAYAIDSRRRNRSEFINGRNEIIAFLSRKRAKELDYRHQCVVPADHLAAKPSRVDTAGKIEQ